MKRLELLKRLKQLHAIFSVSLPLPAPAILPEKYFYCCPVCAFKQSNIQTFKLFFKVLHGELTLHDRYGLTEKMDPLTSETDPDNPSPPGRLIADKLILSKAPAPKRPQTAMG